MGQRWLLLVYRVPREPTARRVFVWRKLKQLGALAIQDAVWVLPLSERTRERMQWLAAEIRELDGEAMLWDAERIDGEDAEGLRLRFSAPVDAEYRGLLDALAMQRADPAELSKRYQEVRRRDYFESAVGAEVREALLRAGGGAAS